MSRCLHLAPDCTQRAAGINLISAHACAALRSDGLSLPALVDVKFVNHVEWALSTLLRSGLRKRYHDILRKCLVRLLVVLLEKCGWGIWWRRGRWLSLSWLRRGSILWLVLIWLCVLIYSQQQSITTIYRTWRLIKCTLFLKNVPKNHPASYKVNEHFWVTGLCSFSCEVAFN